MKLKKNQILFTLTEDSVDVKGKLDCPTKRIFFLARSLRDQAMKMEAGAVIQLLTEATKTAMKPTKGKKNGTQKKNSN